MSQAATTPIAPEEGKSLQLRRIVIGALVVLVDGELVLYVERGGRTLLSYVDGQEHLGMAAKALADAVHAGALGALSVERADGAPVHQSPLGDALAAAGFRATPRGLRLRG